MADYTTVDMTVRSLLADILRTDVPPPGAKAWGFYDDNGALITIPLSDLFAPAAAGTGLASATYEVGTSGAQTIRQPGATWFGDVGIETSGGKSIPLSFGTGYTFVAGTLTVLAVAGAVAGDTITYTYASGVVGGAQPAPGYTPPAIVATVAGEEVGFATLDDAIAARPSAIYLHEDVELSTVPARFDGVLFGGGHVITLASSGQLRLGRNASLYNVVLADGGGSVAVVGSGTPSGGSVPTPAECVQAFDCVLEAALNLSAASAYQGLALRGNTVVSNLASGGGPVYLFDLSQVDQYAAGFTIINRRPGSLGNSVNVLILEGSTGTFVTATGVPVNATNQFTFLPLQNLTTNYQNSWDTTSNRLRIPVSGTYEMSLEVKPEDSANTRNYVGKDFFGGMASGTPADVAGAGVWCQVSSSTRASAARTVIKHYNAGEMVGLCTYQENATFNELCALSVLLLKAD